MKKFEQVVSCVHDRAHIWQIPHALVRARKGETKILYLLPSSVLVPRSSSFQDVPCDEEGDGSHEYGIITTSPSGRPRRAPSSYSSSFIADAGMRISFLPSFPPSKSFHIHFFIGCRSGSTYTKPLRSSPLNKIISVQQYSSRGRGCAR